MVLGWFGKADNGQATPDSLLEAAENNQVEPLKAFIETGGAADKVKDIERRTLLHVAAFHGSADAVQLLLRSPRVLKKVDKRDRASRTALHLAAAIGSETCTRAIANASADLDIQDEWGCTPLHLAIKFEQPEAARLLLDLHADPGVRDVKGETAVRMAQECPDPQVNALMMTFVPQKQPLQPRSPTTLQELRRCFLPWTVRSANRAASKAQSTKYGVDSENHSVSAEQVPAGMEADSTIFEEATTSAGTTDLGQGVGSWDAEVQEARNLAAPHLGHGVGPWDAEDEEEAEANDSFSAVGGTRQAASSSGKGTKNFKGIEALRGEEVPPPPSQQGSCLPEDRYRVVEGDGDRLSSERGDSPVVDNEAAEEQEKQPSSEPPHMPEQPKTLAVQPRQEEEQDADPEDDFEAQIVWHGLEPVLVGHASGGNQQESASSLQDGHVTASAHMPSIAPETAKLAHLDDAKEAATIVAAQDAQEKTDIYDMDWNNLGHYNHHAEQTLAKASSTFAFVVYFDAKVDKLEFTIEWGQVDLEYTLDDHKAKPLKQMLEERQTGAKFSAEEWQQALDVRLSTGEAWDGGAIEDDMFPVFVSIQMQEQPYVVKVHPGGEADQRGLSCKDVIIECNGTSTLGKDRDTLMPILKDRPLLLKVVRSCGPEANTDLTVDPHIPLDLFMDKGILGKDNHGLVLEYSGRLPTVAMVHPNSSALVAGILQGDLILLVNSRNAASMSMRTIEKILQDQRVTLRALRRPAECDVTAPWNLKQEKIQQMHVAFAEHHDVETWDSGSEGTEDSD